MSEKTKQNIGNFILAILFWTLVIWLLIHELDKDVEKVCGSTPRKNVPAWCTEYWQDLKNEKADK